MEYEAKLLALLKINSINIEENSLEFITPPIETSEEKVRNPPTKFLMTNQELIDLKNDDEFMLMEVVHENQTEGNQSEFTIVMPEPEIPSTPKVLNFQSSTTTYSKISPARFIKKQAVPKTKPSLIRELKLFLLII